MAWRHTRKETIPQLKFSQCKIEGLFERLAAHSRHTLIQQVN